MINKNIILVLIACLLLPTCVHAEPDNLLIYYGYPSSFNYPDNAWSLVNVALDISQYDLVVLGSGLEDVAHPDHTSTITIISLVDGKVFGYISLCDPDIFNKIEQWNLMCVDGIFLDEAGYDYGTHRNVFNFVVDYIHNKNLIVFVNAWNPDNVMGLADDYSYPNNIYNPGMLESSLITTDWYLLESCPFYHNIYINNYNKCIKCTNLRNEYGINLASVSTIENTHPYGQILFNIHYRIANRYAFNGQGTSDLWYGAGSSIVTLWKKE